MIQLINIDDIKSFKSISLNLDTGKKLDPFILEAQEFDLRPALGEQLYIDFINDFSTSPSLAKYSLLFNGCQYDYSGYKYEHQGIKAALIYWSYARYLIDSNSNPTAFGMVQKTNQFSTPSDEKTIKRKIDQARSGAEAYQNRFVDYIIRNKDLFPLYFGFINSENKRSSGVRIRGIGGNQNMKVGSSYKCSNCGKYTGCNCNRYTNF